MGVRELLALAERGVDDREALDGHAASSLRAAGIDRALAAVRPVPQGNQRPGATCHRAFSKTRSHGSASRRGLPRRDSPQPFRAWDQPPIPSRIGDFGGRPVRAVSAEARSSATLLLAAAPLARNAYELCAASLG